MMLLVKLNQPIAGSNRFQQQYLSSRPHRLPMASPTFSIDCLKRLFRIRFTLMIRKRAAGYKEMVLYDIVE